MKTIIGAGRSVSILLAATLCIGCPGERDYRQAMRDFVIAISGYAKEANPAFAIIPQNGHELLTTDGAPDGPLALEYIAAIDGVGREDLFYGYDDDNTATPQNERDAMLAFMELAEANGVQALITDYCWDQSYMSDSYASNESYGFVSFAADHRDLDDIPDFPATPYNENADDVAALSDAQNMLYLLEPSQFASREAYLGALEASRYDLFIIDFFYEDTPLSSEEVAALKTKPQGGTRLVVCYMSIGEAEDYRYYWQPGWSPGSPAWLSEENPNWPGNYVVQYWETEWQAIIFGGPDAYLDRIVAAGFDGVYLDIIDAYEAFE